MLASAYGEEHHTFVLCIMKILLHKRSYIATILKPAPPSKSSSATASEAPTATSASEAAPSSAAPSPTESTSATAESAPAAASTSSTSSAAAPTASAASSPAPLVPSGKEPFEREQLGGVDEESLILLEALGLDGVGELDGDVVVPEVAEYLVNLAHLLLILEVEGRVEVGHVGLRHLDDEVILAGVGHVAQRDHAFGRSKVACKAAAAAAASSTSAASTTAKSATSSTAKSTTTSAASASTSEAHFNSIKIGFVLQYFFCPSSFPRVLAGMPKWSGFME